MPLFRRRRPEVPGVPPRRDDDGWDHYDGGSLAARPAVTAALAQAPRTFLAVASGRETDPAAAIPGPDLCRYLDVGTRDGVTWGLGLEDAVRRVVSTSDDLLEGALVGQPDVVGVEHEEREIYRVELARPLPADEVLARFVAAVSEAHRALARQRGVAIPDEAP